MCKRRLTVRKDGIVHYEKDDMLYPPVLMGDFDVTKAMKKLADYEDAEEELNKGCEYCNKKSCYNCYELTDCIMHKYSSAEDCKYFKPNNHCFNCGRKLV